MALITPAPHIILLGKIVDTVSPIDFLDRAGIVIDTVRHFAHRFPTSSEGNCISFRWIGNDANIEQQDRNAWERVKRMDVDMFIDLKLTPELKAADPTGWLYYSAVVAVVMEALMEEGTSQVWPGFCERVIDGDDEPDEDSKPDEGRLVKGASVLYRVRSDAPNVLLGLGVNG